MINEVTKQYVINLSNDLQKIIEAIEEYNQSDLVDESLEIYLSDRQRELTDELKNICFGSNVEILR